MDFEKLLKIMVEKGGSDLFITVGVPPSIKIHGKIVPVTKQALTPEQSREIVQTADYSGPDRRKQHVPRMGPERRRATARASQPEASIRIVGRDDISLKRRMNQSLIEKRFD